MEQSRPIRCPESEQPSLTLCSKPASATPLRESKHACHNHFKVPVSVAKALVANRAQATCCGMLPSANARAALQGDLHQFLLLLHSHCRG